MFLDQSSIDSLNNQQNSTEYIVEKPPPSPERSINTSPNHGYKNQSLKQRINSLVLKTLQENTGKDRQALMNPNVNNFTDSWKIKVIQNTRVICSVKECKQVIDEIMSSRVNKKTDNDQWEFSENKVVVGFDCEGINLGKKSINPQKTIRFIVS